ncbi:MAG: hypothetical protein HYU29_06920 [Chloroflexi bacterium]|nr:hypothetical protein [Chloroflexota bacterium]
MKEKMLVYQGDPCTMRLDDPEIQTVEDVRARGIELCPFYADRRQCSLPRYGCVRVAGLKVARYVLLFYAEAAERTLAMEIEEFRQRAPLPPTQVEAYVDTPQYHYRHVADPKLVVQRVGDYARAVLDLQPGERIFRSPEEPTPLIKEPGIELPQGEATEPKEVAALR